MRGLDRPGVPGRQLRRHRERRRDADRARRHRRHRLLRGERLRPRHAAASSRACRTAARTEPRAQRTQQASLFGYACLDTPERMPLPIMLAHGLARRLDEVRAKGVLPYLAPDGKTLVAVEFEDDQPTRIHTVIVSVQHTPALDQAGRLEGDIREAVLPPVFDAAPLGLGPADEGADQSGRRVPRRRPSSRCGPYGPQECRRHVRRLRPPGRGCACPGRIPRTSTASAPTSRGTWRATWWRPASRGAARSSSATASARCSPSPSPCRRSAPARWATLRSSAPSSAWWI